MPSYTYKMATGDDCIVTIDSVTLFHPMYNNNLNSNPNPIRYINPRFTYLLTYLRGALSGVTIAIGRPGNAGGPGAQNGKGGPK